MPKKKSPFKKAAKNFCFALSAALFAAPGRALFAADLKAEKIKTEESCGQSGSSRLYSEKYKMRQSWNFTGQIEELAAKHFEFIKKPIPSRCPAGCRQINSYKVASKLYPLDTKKNSCPAKEAKERYSFKKEFPFKAQGESEKAAHKNMVDWVFDTFIYPYFSIPFFTPSKEFTENNLEKACPSCSFYFDYSYKHAKGNKLALSASVKCGDMKKFLSDFQSEFVLINKWKCAAKKARKAAGRKP